MCGFLGGSVVATDEGATDEDMSRDRVRRNLHVSSHFVAAVVSVVFVGGGAVRCSTEQVKVVGHIGRLTGARPDPSNAAHLLDLLRSACGFVAASLVRYDPVREHHVGVANHGYDPDLDRYFVERFPGTPASTRIRHGSVPLRIDDAPYDFRDSDTYLEELQPRGFDDGMTAGLFTDAGAYVGMLHMSSDQANRFDNDIRDFVGAVSSMAATVVESTAADREADHTVNWAGGDDPPMTIVRAAEHFVVGRHASLRTLWHHDGQWQQVDFTRSVSGGHGVADGVDVTAHPRAIPYSLTRRELEIATAVATGLPNKAIARCLQISPRTVGKHVERVLDKLACSSRSQAAAICVQEGIIDLELVVAERATSRLLGHPVPRPGYVE